MKQAVLFLVLVCTCATAIEVKIVYRYVRKALQLQQDVRKLFGEEVFPSQLNIEQWLKLYPAVEPGGYGHVSIEFPDQNGSLRIMGWQPQFAVPPEIDPDAALELMKWLYGDGLPYTPRSIKGVFEDDTEWAARDGYYDPAYFFSVDLAEWQINLLRTEILRMNAAPSYHYQLIATERSAEGYRFPCTRFNCVIAVKRLLDFVGVRLPFDVQQGGSLMRFCLSAEPFEKVYRPRCVRDLLHSATGGGNRRVEVAPRTNTDM